MSAAAELLSQEFTLGYTYTRTTGPVVGEFLTALRDRKMRGIKGSDGRVLMPPMEYDPVDAAALSEFVDVADCGEVVSWTWVSQPRKAHPSDSAFAWALIKLDGADTAMLHWVDAGDESAMKTGMRVKARWANETKGFITDINGFVPEAVALVADYVESDAELEPISGIECPSYMTYNFTAGKATARYLAQLRNGKLVGQRCPNCANVYIPPRGSCAACGVPTEEEVELSNKATVESYTIVYIPIPNNPIKPPYVIANLVLDGANLSFLHLLSECDNNNVRIGMRVEAVWKPKEEWGYAMENIKYFKPIDEPDMPVEQIGKQKSGE
ncbi:OB-fold domain-containing protein [Spongiibacter sp. KMU-158]|uniref:OB-fold domain-containing protein n=1 Tax=Spongiibacter pelagi TaxID=2760804 RepID=A0A927C2Q9_9GAMM|nr:OB-fold nucleic acid binding domain-containing protein [Spongiibacter pelagi]MBD2858400.1 OB-fold domain-containing protein [Spongiibacter pelagi]